MKYSALIISFLQATLCWNLNECGERPTNLELPRVKRHNPTILIVGGEEADPHAWPWMVSVWYSGELICGGTIINERYILSAAHCFRRKSTSSPEDYMIKVASHTRTDGVEYDIEEIKSHPQFTYIEKYNDIALLKLRKVLTIDSYASPVYLPSLGDDYTNQSVTVIGWGDSWFGGPESQVLQQVSIQVVNNTICNNNYSPWPNYISRGITDDMLCAGTSRKSACMGDSGGPLMHKASLKWILIGIVSFGRKCSLTGYLTVYTRVSSFLPWINENMDM